MVARLRKVVTNRMALRLFSWLAIASVFSYLLEPSTALGNQMLLVNPTSGPPGQSAMAQGSSYWPNDTITVRWNDVISGPVVASGASNGTGSFNIPFTVPNSATAGPFDVYASDTHGGTASAIFTVTGGGGGPSCTSPPPANVTP